MRNKTIYLSLLLALSLVLSACSAITQAQPAQTVLAQSQPALAQSSGQAQPVQAQVGQAAQNSQPPLRTISVNGNGKVYLTPDIAYIYLGVHTESPDAKEAVSSNNAQSQKVKDALTQFGIDPKDIQTSNFSIYPNQQYDNNGKPTTLRYIVDNTVYVTVRKLDKIGDLLDAVVQAGANSIQSISFDVADRSAALSQARKLAVTDAHDQAQELAQAAGVTLGDVQTISYYSSPTPVPMYDAKSLGAAAAPASVPISTGQLVLSVDVSMVYTIK
jgi:uncharacterized protein YggE